MASIYDLKPKFQNLLRPLVYGLAQHRVKANQVTIAAAVLSIAGGVAITLFHEHRWPLLLIPFLLFVRMALNAIDGMLAREHNMQTSLGAVLNELADIISDIALYLPLALISGVHGGLLVCVVLLAVISEFTGVLAVSIGASRRYDGPMGKSDRAFVFGGLGLLLGLGVPLESGMTMILLAVSVLLVVTVINRARRALLEAPQ